MYMYNVAIIGCGMMGCEHILSLNHVSNVQIKFLCDPLPDKGIANLKKIDKMNVNLFHDERAMYDAHREEIDILVIATPNYLHASSILLWGKLEHLSILVEKPVAISESQIDELCEHIDDLKANIWVGMEYRYISPIQTLRREIKHVGKVRQITIRENRYPFLEKVGKWNRYANLTGDTFVEKCCHFFDLFLLFGGDTNVVRCESLSTRNVDPSSDIIDGGYTLLELSNGVMCCLELSMYAEGSRHQEEITITGDKGRLEAYLPEMSVYKYTRPNDSFWIDKTEPPPPTRPEIFHLDVAAPYEGYHHGSTYQASPPRKYMHDQVVRES